jgi:mannose-6-phosphate isomerase
VFIFIRNVAREYAWGDTGAIPQMLGEPETGQPQAELWLGTHVDDPADLSHETELASTLLDLIQGDVDQYGVDGVGLPFLLKVLGIGQPLSLQVHPDRAQAVEGFERENALGIDRESPNRNYRDMNHKPEVVVALSDDFAALAGFRPVADVVAELRAVVAVASDSADALADVADWLSAAGGTGGAGGVDAGDDAAARRDFMAWAFSGADEVSEAIEAVAANVAAFADELRRWSLRQLIARHPGDPGILVSLLMHCVKLREGEALFLPPRHIHAYLSGVAIEVMASSDNVLRAGLTQKHIDVAELTRVMTFDELQHPHIDGVDEQPGLTLWQPDVPDFSVRRVQLNGGAQSVVLGAEYPLVLICTEGKIVAERSDDGLDEFANLARGQALYISSGDPVTFSGKGEIFLATVGEGWVRASG